jgi:hypothetical protein
MDAEFWIYLIIGIIYFVSRLFKKGEQAGSDIPQPPRRERARPRQAQPPPSADAERPLTFEELLREITEGRQASKRAPQPVPAYESYETVTDDEAQSLEEVPVDEEEVSPTRWKPYEQVPATTFERRSLEETLHLEDTVVEFKKFDVFEQKQEKRRADDYIRILRDPGSLKQAFVLSEILKRKF